MSISTCNILTNPSFESGSLSPWYTNIPNIARVTNSTPAYNGTYTLDLTTTPNNNNNNNNSISQSITNLTRTTTYDFSIQVNVPNSGADFCHISAYVGANATSGLILSVDVEPTGEWTPVRGNYTARGTSDVLMIGAGCTSSDGSDSWHVFMDEVVLGRRGC
ncbi:hypothetical protein BO78DRAFT_450473 [Aspergillus sclerotiicarbonarius CBS 121057]|uniref:CBM-cenC domain-containing protein n=1 Tax=Aspergillus sclerotiicarbonarius (strain CBS 121057 / IBT 28362) TaxID=1448318 RepID=A0A319ELY3_ASPSB|nr:hypothetical protein BO78DRAFT_450473 [Aspergillus sclerotiicarbonarius CBS 121057]